MWYRVLVFVLLLATWIVFSGLIDPFHLALGVISCALVTWMSSDLLFADRSVSMRARLRQAVGWAKYMPWLLWEIYLANLQILRLVFSRDLKRDLQPSIVRVRTDLDSDFEKFILANSITLTPGTVTARIHGSDVYVHAITREAAEGLDGEMDRRIAEIFDCGQEAEGGADE